MNIQVQFIWTKDIIYINCALIKNDDTDEMINPSLKLNDLALPES